MAAATYRLPGPTILSTRGIVVGAVGQRRDRVRAADAEQPRHAGFERRRHHGRFGPRADGDRPRGRRRRAPAPRSSAATRAAGSVRPARSSRRARAARRAARPRRPGRPRRSPVLRESAGSDAGDVARRLPNGAPHVGRNRAAPGASHLARGDTSSGAARAVERPREAQQRAVAARRARVDDRRATRRSNGAVDARADSRCRGARSTCSGVCRPSIDLHRRPARQAVCSPARPVPTCPTRPTCPTEHDLVQRILDDALRRAPPSASGSDRARSVPR